MMQNASNLDVEENGRGATSVVANELWQRLAAREDVRLTSIHPRGAVVVAQGQNAEGVYLLRAGRVKVSLSSAEGRVIILRVAHAGALLGVNAALKGTPCDATVETLERSRIDFISRSDFLRLIDESLAIRASLTRFLTDELTDLVECVRSLILSQSAAEKLAGLLLRLSNGNSTNSSQFDLGLTHEEIAQMIGTSRETVTRLFADFRRKQIVSFSNNTIVVKDRNALETLAGITANCLS
jgi:CRP/FNR family transcriptional regulator